MAYMARAEGYEDEQTDDEDLFEPRTGRGRVLIGTDEYIESRTPRRPHQSQYQLTYLGIVGSASPDGTSSDIEITHKNKGKGKRKAGEKVEWSDDGADAGEDLYERFKKRKIVKRKKTAAIKKKLSTKKKETVSNGKSARDSGEPPEKKESMWGDVEDYGELMDDEIPEYLHDRRKEFDRKYQVMKEGGLLCPPRYKNIDFSDDERLEVLDERPAFPESVEPSRPYKDIELPHSAGVIPASIARYLRDYQVEGVAYLHELFVYQKGGILGDDMGLGKTVQVAAFLTAAFGKTGDERDWKRMRKIRRAGDGKRWYPRVLIVCPGSLIENWKNELNRWGWWHVDKYHGSPQDRDSVLQTAASGRLEVVITTYTTYRNHKSNLNMVKWDCVVADECHQLKERSSATTQAMNEVNALCRIGLTGTAIQNKYEELWTLLNWTNPGRFGPISTWISSISEPLRIGQSHDATYHQLKQARQTAKKLVQNLLPQFFLCRMKSLIAHQLPKKTDKVVFCPLTEIQRDAYERFLEGEIVDIVKTSSEPCECNSGKKRGWCCYATIPDSNTKWQVSCSPCLT